MCSLLGRVLITGRSCCRINQIISAQPSPQYFQRSQITRFCFNAWNHSKSKSTTLHQTIRKQCTKVPNVNANPGNGAANSSPPPKMSLFAKFKSMYKDYWYVLVPVHVVTSIGWFGVFYKVSTSGVDVGLYLKKLGVSETIIKHITESGMGHIAVAWALYKVATPARYAVTLGGTTLSINVLRNMGYIKPAKELMAKGRTKIQSLKDKQIPKN